MCTFDAHDYGQDWVTDVHPKVQLRLYYFLPSSLRSIEEHARGIGLTADRRAGQLVSFHDGRMIDSKGARVIWRFVDSLVLNRPSTAHDRMPVNRYRE